MAQSGPLSPLGRRALDLRAERAIGGLLAETITPRSGRTLLPDGISKSDSSRWQRIASLPDADFEAELAKPGAARRLMQIASHPVLSNATHASLLPSSWAAETRSEHEHVLKPKQIRAALFRVGESPSRANRQKRGHSEALPGELAP